MLLSRAVLGFLLSVAASAQTGPPWNGAFTAAQAQSGQAVYRESCARCHGQDLSGGENAPALAGAAFLARWDGKSALDLLERTRRTMPTDNPGGLAARQYAECVAYMLSANGYPAGVRELGAAAAPVETGRNTEWRYYGGDAGSLKYSPLDQIDATNVARLKTAWTWSGRNFGKRPEFNWEVTPLMVGGRLFVTAGTRRDAVDARTGETLWM